MKHVTVRLNPLRMLGWHRALVEHLRSTGFEVAVAYGAAGPKLHSAIRSVLALEGYLATRTGTHDGDNLGGNPGAAHEALVVLGPADLPADPTPRDTSTTIDLAASTLVNGTMALVPLFDGQAGEPAMWTAIFAGRAPDLELHDGRTGQRLWIGKPAIEAPHAAAASAAAVLVRVMEGIGHGLAGRLASSRPSTVRAGHGSLSVAAMGMAARKGAAKLRRAYERRPGAAPQWSVAWVMTEGAAPSREVEFDPRQFRLLADDGRRYYADPWLFERDGQIHLFVEEYPYATSRGIISATVLPADGSQPSPPRPVLETQYHLSYPQVFLRDGEIWMLPEQHASGALILYRCTRFPDRWEETARLVDRPLHDATLFEFGEKLWIAANTTGPPTIGGGGGLSWGSSWDALSLWSADALLGPWTAHAGNPVLIDAGAARSGGAVYVRGDGLYRPVQDCRTGYGTAIQHARIDQLDSRAFAQTIMRRKQFPAYTGLLGPHHFSHVTTSRGRFEAVDVFGTASDLKRQAWDAGTNDGDR